MLASGIDWSIPPWAFAISAIAALVVAVLARAGWIHVFGPVLFYEMIRAARRGRYFLLRGLYAGGLFALLLWIRWLWGMEHRYQDEAKPDDMAGLAAWFFTAYATVQYFAVILLTPAYVAGCIADDKERRVLEFLLATDLANREIIFGKLVARVGNLLLFLMAGLPVLSFVQFFGGIDPTILLVTTGATAMTMLGLVGVSMVNSVQRRRGRDAIVMTYGVALAYVAFSQIAWGLLNVARFSREPWAAAILATMEPVVDYLRWGDPIRAFSDLTQLFNMGSGQGPAIMALFRRFATFHAVVFVLGVAYSVWRVRAIALAQASAGDGPKKGKRDRPERTVSDRPMVWKEVVAEGTLKLGWLARIGIDLLIVSGFIPVILMAYSALALQRSESEQWSHGVNSWLRTMNPILTSLMFLGIAIRAAGSVGSERDRDTLTSLLTTPLTADEIIRGKYWGAIASVRKLAYWLAAVWIIGLICGAVRLWILPVELIALIPPACAAAAVGLYFSVLCSTTLRALTVTTLAVLFGLGGHWIFCGMCCIAPLSLGRMGSDSEFVFAFMGGMTPPAVFAMLPFHPQEKDWFEARTFGYLVVAAFGHLMWCVVAAVFYSMAVEKFTRLTNRERFVYRPGPPRPAA